MDYFFNMIAEGYCIGIFRGATDSIRQLDLSFANVRIMRFVSDEFKDLLIELQKDERLYTTYEKDFIPHKSNLLQYYVFAPKHFEQANNANVYLKLRNALLIAFPSDFNLVGIISFNEPKRGKYTSRGSINYANQYVIQDDTPKYLSLDGMNIQDCNAFLKLFYEQYDKLDFLNITIEGYLESFTHTNIKMVIINLFIAFDALINSDTNVTRKVARLLAVLNSDTTDEGELINWNYRQFYNLRSAIVHGNSVEMKSMVEFLSPIRALLSRTIIEVVLNGFVDKKSLNTRVFKCTYGQRKNVTRNYQQLELDTVAVSLIKQKVSKYKKMKK